MQHYRWSSGIVALPFLVLTLVALVALCAFCAYKWRKSERGDDE
jgi:hypothetical protein